MISDFYTTTFTINRSAWTTDGSGNPYSTETLVDTFSGHLQQANPRLVENLGLSLTKTFAVWCTLGTDVLEGDTLRADGVTYSVRAVMRYALGQNRHLELIIEQDNV